MSSYDASPPSPEMHALALYSTAEGRELRLSSFPIPVPLPHEVLLRPSLALICGTDLELLSGYKSLPHPQILGHEFVATVAAHPGGHGPPHLPVGTRVVAEINCVSPSSLSRTHASRAHDPARTCVGIFGRHGAFAEYLTVPAVNVHVVPKDVPDACAVFTEPVAAACEILEQVRVGGESRVAVLGAGRLGFVVAHVLTKAAGGASVVLLTRSSGSRLDRELSVAYKLGVKLGLAECESIGHRREFDIVVDCTASSEGLERAVELVVPRGTVVLKSTVAPGGRGAGLSQAVVKEVTIIGSRCGPFEVALRLMEKGLVDPRGLVDGRFKLEKGLEAFDSAKKKGTLKVMLEIK